jgi:hypothetical protein
LPPSTSTIIDAEEGVNFIADADDPDSLQKSRFFSGQFEVTHVVNKYLTLAGHYQGIVTKRRNDDGALGPGFQSEFTSIFGGNIHTADVHAIWTPSPMHTFTGGYEFESESFRNEGDSEFGSRSGRMHHRTATRSTRNTSFTCSTETCSSQAEHARSGSTLERLGSA